MMGGFPPVVNDTKDLPFDPNEIGENSTADTSDETNYLLSTVNARNRNHNIEQLIKSN